MKKWKKAVGRREGKENVEMKNKKGKEIFEEKQKGNKDKKQ